MSLMKLNKSLKSTMMPVVWGFLAVFFVGILFSFSMGNSMRAGRGAGGAATDFARINGQEISQQDFKSVLDREYEQMKRMAQFSHQQVTLKDQADAPGKAYDQLLDEHARFAAAEAEGVRVDPTDAEKELRKQVDDQLKEVGQGATPEEINRIKDIMLAPDKVEAQRRQMAADKLREKVTAAARPVEVKVAHILIKVDGISEVAALRKAEDLSRQAKAGADFAKLAQANSADPGSKIKGGEVGWASAEPPAPPTGKNAKPDPNAATTFVPEFTAAALRLQKGQVSNPVRSSFGYHVIKALDERPFEPKLDPADLANPAPKPGEKPDPSKPAPETPEQKRQKKIDAYRTSVGSKIADGIFSEWKQRLQGQVEAQSPWLKGYLLEAQAGSFAVGPDGKPIDTSKRMDEAIAQYELAMKSNDPTAGRALAYKLATLYQKQATALETAKKEAEAKAEYAKAQTLLDSWAKKSSDSEMYFLQGEVLEKNGDKTKALEAYQASMEQAFGNADVLRRLGDKFKALGRADLTKKSTEKMAEVVKRQDEEKKAQQAQFQRMMQEQMQKQAAKKPGAGGTTTIPVTPAK